MEKTHVELEERFGDVCPLATGRVTYLQFGMYEGELPQTSYSCRESGAIEDGGKQISAFFPCSMEYAQQCAVYQRDQQD